ncbi:UNVERIFIED_CONTAM: hypothetical protein PYX00_000211 [Menopon gallinae]|uniref:Lysophospholipid acyltransferase 7 n=1 Tax=Menopon gallinae TaxID=328185 RepID=A0AAW2I929_9NEOP
MEWDDVIYLSLLIFTIVFGHYFRNLHDEVLKKRVSTTIGFAIVLLVSGKHALHPVICVFINSYIITRLDKRFCHACSFCFTFAYLIFFRTTAYVGIPYAPSHTNMIQMVLTLKLIGLAFEVHDSHKEAGENPSQKGKKTIDPNILDILHYSFCYVGVLTGPYYTYKTYCDYFSKGYERFAPCESETLKKLKYIPLYMVIFLVSSYYYPIQYADSAEFHSERSFWYRLFYIIPVFITFRMRIYIGLILSECACIMAGLGAYPADAETKPGMGPTKNDYQMCQLSQEELKKIDYDFNTVKNLDIWHTELDPTVRNSIRYWNMCVQYWMAFVVYRRFPYKAFRTAATFAVSAIWHGIYAGYFLCLGVVPFYLSTEDIWLGFIQGKAVGSMKNVVNLFLWFVRTQAFSYMGIAFSLLTMERGLKYYGSVYYVYHLTTIIALVSGVILQKLTRKRKYKTDS